jgi:hypothetical protein
MRCLGCDKTVKAKKSRSMTWDIWQICPKCFMLLVPNYYTKNLKIRIMRHTQ